MNVLFRDVDTKGIPRWSNLVMVGQRNVELASNYSRQMG